MRVTLENNILTKETKESNDVCAKHVQIYENNIQEQLTDINKESGIITIKEKNYWKVVTIKNRK